MEPSENARTDSGKAEVLSGEEARPQDEEEPEVEIKPKKGTKNRVNVAQT